MWLWLGRVGDADSHPRGLVPAGPAVLLRCVLPAVTASLSTVSVQGPGTQSLLAGCLETEACPRMVPETWPMKAGADAGGGLVLSSPGDRLAPHWSLMLGVCRLWEHVYIDKTGPLQLPTLGSFARAPRVPRGGWLWAQELNQAQEVRGRVGMGWRAAGLPRGWGALGDRACRSEAVLLPEHLGQGPRAGPWGTLGAAGPLCLMMSSVTSPWTCPGQDLGWTPGCTGASICRPGATVQQERGDEKGQSDPSGQSLEQALCPISGTGTQPGAP